MGIRYEEMTSAEMEQSGRRPPDELENRPREILGQGSFGVVFKGSIPENNRWELPTQEIAIKVNTGTKKIIEFNMERCILESIEHPNIIKLVGFADDNNRLCLVYEYMRRGTLKINISDLCWPKTLQIMRDMASVICHLHQQDPPIIFRDLKSENILMDENFDPKLSDFGLAKRGKEGLKCGGTEGSSDVTAIYGSATPLCDIYSIGILILELLANKVFKDRGKLLAWVKGKALVKGKVRNVKSVLRKNLLTSGCTVKNARRAIKLGLQCASYKNDDRPKMHYICKELSKLGVMRSLTSCCLNFFDLFAIR
ncbi:probable serine/threonine-protein kinase PBL8 isoform X2 [Papaver somniferum]|uniref:probable serine/threonine-protein kinase PBL8 isoform X2 n=1 Tax=Papaver somniferum TaxID=3469 RepID=UPI000E6FCEBC|nr:probable serine/threonine-protein kinase PBL8 isoform X2 [Papaver somniferum]